MVKKFEKCENERNYNILISFLKEKRRLIQIPKFKLILTGKNGVVIYNSEKENTYDNYKLGLIKFNNQTEVEISNRAEKEKFHTFVRDGKTYFSLKIGSQLTASFENLPEWEQILFLIVMIIIIIGVVAALVYQFWYMPEEEVERLTPITSGAAIRMIQGEDTSGTLYLIYKDGTTFGFGGDEEFALTTETLNEIAEGLLTNLQEIEYATVNHEFNRVEFQLITEDFTTFINTLSNRLLTVT